MQEIPVEDSPILDIAINNSRLVSDEGNSYAKGDSSPNVATSSSSFEPTLTLELQTCLSEAELEISELHGQVLSKTRHLQFAQKALLEYEDEVQSLKKQLKRYQYLDDLFHSPVKYVQSWSQCSSREDIPRTRSESRKFASSTESRQEGVNEITDQLIAENRNLKQLNVAINEELADLRHELHLALSHAQEFADQVDRLAEQNRNLVKEKAQLRTKLVQAQEDLLDFVENRDQDFLDEDLDRLISDSPKNGEIWFQTFDDLVGRAGDKLEVIQEQDAEFDCNKPERMLQMTINMAC